MATKPSPIQKPGPATVILISDTFIDGAHVKAGTVRTVNGTNASLLFEANRCVEFDPNNPEHRATLEATKKADKEAIATAEKAAEEAAEKARKATEAAEAADKAARGKK